MIEDIAFKNFRNLSLKRTLAPGVNIIIEQNGAGKSNFLDGIFNLAYGRSFRTGSAGLEITNDSEVPFARIDANLLRENPTQLTIIFSKAEDRNFKKFQINGAGKSRVVFTGMLSAVLFAPHDLDIVNGAPEIRRDELDDFMSQLSEEYEVRLREYKLVIRNRNRILAAIADGFASKDELSYWTEKMVVVGSQILEGRLEILRGFLPMLREQAAKLFHSEIKELDLKYYSRITSLEAIGDIENNFRQILIDNQHKELAAKKSLYGPHRDDWELYHGQRTLKSFGSRGQQRLGALILKLAMWRYLTGRLERKVVLLLDDVMSELDSKHRANVEAVISKLGTQVIVTGTDEEHFSKKFLRQAQRITLAGEV